jgi:hypothetical protein
MEEGDRPKGGGGGDNPTARSSAACPLHHASRGPPPPRCARGGIKEIRSRDASRARALLTTTTPRKIRYPKRERSAERRMSAIAAPSAAARFSRTRRARHSARTLRHSPPATTPMAQPQNRVSRKRALPGVLPPWPKCLRLSTLRADRSFCRSTGDPGPPGSGSANPRAGTAPRSAFQACPSGKAPSVSEVRIM